VLAGERLILDCVDWQSYSRFLRLFAERPGYRLTYDRGVLEITSPSGRHDHLACLIGRFVEALTEELGLLFKSGRSTTFRSRRARRGLEPDNSYWVANEPVVRSKDEVDLRVDPPPDLCVEIDITSSSLDRMSIYARLRVPEVWRFDDEGLMFNVLQPNHHYAVNDRSPSFPMLTPDDVMRFLALRLQEDENAIVRQFREWVRLNRPSSGSTPQNP
jgi:Uma2 family endonuclease